MNTSALKQMIMVSSPASNPTLPLEKVALFNENGSPAGLVQSSQIREIVVLTQAAYDDLDPPSEDVLYYVVG